MIWSGLPLHQFKKRLAVKAFLLSMYKMGRFFKRSFHPRITVRSLLLVLVGIQTPIMCSNFVYFSISIITCSFGDHYVAVVVAFVVIPVQTAAESDLVVVETALVVENSLFLALIFEYYNVFFVLASF